MPDIPFIDEPEPDEHGFQISGIPIPGPGRIIVTLWNDDDPGAIEHLHCPQCEALLTIKVELDAIGPWCIPTEHRTWISQCGCGAVTLPAVPIEKHSC